MWYLRNRRSSHTPNFFAVKAYQKLFPSTPGTKTTKIWGEVCNFMSLRSISWYFLKVKCLIFCWQPRVFFNFQSFAKPLSAQNSQSATPTTGKWVLWTTPSWWGWSGSWWKIHQNSWGTVSSGSNGWWHSGTWEQKIDKGGDGEGNRPTDFRHEQDQFAQGVPTGKNRQQTVGSAFLAATSDHIGLVRPDHFTRVYGWVYEVKLSFQNKLRVRFVRFTHHILHKAFRATHRLHSWLMSLSQ